MKFIFRENIVGAKSDYDLEALDGIMVISLSEKTISQDRILDAINSFEASNPSFKWVSCELR